MLFNSYIFVLLFLPATIAAFAFAGRFGGHRAMVWMLVCASLVFYGWWDVGYLALLVASMVVNFLLGGAIARTRSGALLFLGLSFNLGVLAWFKYAGFLSGIFAAASGADWTIAGIVLPLGISFIVFQKIAYLVDLRRGEAPVENFAEFCLFVTFFPQLIAGPIVRHSELLPQIRQISDRSWLNSTTAFAVGIFALALAKKVFIADYFGELSRPVFAAADDRVPTFIEAWMGALAYTLQIYFDFSAYSEMALGLALFFGVRLPANFDSPYKASSPIEFWRRWHMSLSRFLRDYLYVPLGGSRRGIVRHMANLMVVMLLGGLWHGANWTFVAWGALHGAGLVVNHAWRALWNNCPPEGFVLHLLGWCGTFTLVVAAWVLFRAESFTAASNMWTGMFALAGLVLPEEYAARVGGIGALADDGFVQFAPAPLYVGREMSLPILFGVAWVALAPNMLDLFGRARVALGLEARPAPRLRFAPSLVWGIASGAILALAILDLETVSEFLYFQF